MSTKGPGYQPITRSDEVFKGEDQDIVFTIYDTAAGTVSDIDGWTLQFKFAAEQGDAALLTKSVSVTDGNAGQATLALAAADTSGLTAQTGFYTLSRTDSGENQVLAYGPFVLQARLS